MLFLYAGFWISMNRFLFIRRFFFFNYLSSSRTSKMIRMKFSVFITLLMIVIVRERKINKDV